MDIVSPHRGEICIGSDGYRFKRWKDEGPYRSRLLEVKMATEQNTVLVIPVRERVGEELLNVNQYIVSFSFDCSNHFMRYSQLMCSLCCTLCSLKFIVM